MKFIYLFWILAILLPFFGCVSYHPGIGANIPLPFDRVYVAPVKNKSFAPQSQALLTKSVRNKLANQPGIKLAESPDNAAILEITIIKYGQSSAGYEYVEKKDGDKKYECISRIIKFLRVSNAGTVKIIRKQNIKLCRNWSKN